jgi:hypothetical protein
MSPEQGNKVAGSEICGSLAPYRLTSSTWCLRTTLVDGPDRTWPACAFAMEFFLTLLVPKGLDGIEVNGAAQRWQCGECGDERE